jgi:hypothetical protein
VTDYCVTVRGTVGIEAARLGIPVILGGTGRYSGKGFTIDPQSRSAYLTTLARIHEIPALTAQQRELANRFAYATFVMRPLSFDTIVLEKGGAARADQDYDARTVVNARTSDDWQSAPDMHALSCWLNSNDEDFLVEGGNPAVELLAIQDHSS